VTLRYLSAADFTANLPPGIRSSLIMKSGNANSFYYTGPEESYNRLLAALPEIDKPARQIRYDLLIIQFQETKDSTWKSGLSASNVAMGDRTGAAAQLGSVLSLNFDVVTAFGLTFAASLQSAVSENKASVFADTTLHGVSGEKISFRNTNTYRYRDNNLDPETGKPVYTGVTREIASGLTLDITGTVSGDGMITSKVTASVSRQGADVSKTTGNPPPTSEKSITTEVRSRSGDPVILSGLVQNDESATGERAPFLSKIPLIGNLFAAKTTATERTEMIIYLLPNAETELAPDKPAFETQAERSRRVYRTFILKEAL
ncbi:MAG: type II and III secretion system protein, partial [Treponema sp.]|jgi:type II secretory pathway component GspD/PulD (secretin)|nr:type II and III secretion system protein [Treponema sp.]